MKEEVIEYDGHFLLQDDEPFLKIANDLDGEYEAKWYEKIFDTNIYVGVDYRFDYNKLLDLFKKYEEKYSEKKAWENCETYDFYNPLENGGVLDINYSSLKFDDVEKVFNEDGTLSSNITVEVRGGKNYSCLWGHENCEFHIRFFKYNEKYPNIVNYARFKSLEKMKEFFNDLKECIVSIDCEELNNRIERITSEIKEDQRLIETINGILKSSI